LDRWRWLEWLYNGLLGTSVERTKWLRRTDDQSVNLIVKVMKFSSLFFAGALAATAASQKVKISMAMDL
jgi:hypothetical protein